MSRSLCLWLIIAAFLQQWAHIYVVSVIVNNLRHYHLFRFKEREQTTKSLAWRLATSNICNVVFVRSHYAYPSKKCFSKASFWETLPETSKCLLDNILQFNYQDEYCLRISAWSTFIVPKFCNECLRSMWQKKQRFQAFPKRSLYRIFLNNTRNETKIYGLLFSTRSFENIHYETVVDFFLSKQKRLLFIVFQLQCAVRPRELYSVSG